MSKMLVEEMESHDWKVDTLDKSDYEGKKSKSVSSYYLPEWYDQMSDLTFKTYMYKLDEIPEVLPFTKCMVRTESRSPKDSEYWSYVTTKKEMLNLFKTSLRCLFSRPETYCIREWVDLTDEYRCFWNNGLVAVSSESNNEPPVDQILDYINKIKDRIIYHRCVFDIAHIKETNELIFIEYNSWETNSGAHRFDWNLDTDILYSREVLVIRWMNGEKRLPFLPFLPFTSNIRNVPFNRVNFTLPKTNYGSNWLVTDKYIYITNDIWLGRFDLNLNPLNWRRGIFRFSRLILCVDGSIYVHPQYYHYDLTPSKIRSKQKIHNVSSFGYGIPVVQDDQEIFVHMLDNCELSL